jgi:hypothetical protein
VTQGPRLDSPDRPHRAEIESGGVSVRGTKRHGSRGRNQPGIGWHSDRAPC